MAESSQLDEPDRAAGAAIARALRRGRADTVEARTVRAMARAAIFGDPIEGNRVDRYFVIELLGRGGMGSVYSAYDPRLERKVALKVLKPDVAGRPDGSTLGRTARDRLIREARALARVIHPNVVAVYDAGVYGNDVFLTMELVAGENLRKWMDANPDATWDTTLRLLVQAGRGLAAAHTAGLVHRDFKPENILVGLDGVARVVDFGVARDDPGGEPDSDATASTDGRGSQTADAGTPAYLAPERGAGQPADVRSDVFSFSVTLFEALVRARPSMMRDVDDRVSRRPAWPAGTPGWLTRAVERGLEPDPEARPQSMPELLDVLERGLRGEAVRRRWRRWIPRVGASLAAVALAVGAVVGGQTLDRRERVAACEAAGAEIDALWPGRADAVDAGIRRGATSYAGSTIEGLGPWLTDWATDWKEARMQGCVAESVNQTWSHALRRRADGCLDVRRAELERLVELLAAGDTAAVPRAVTAAVELTPPSTCVDEARLARGSWPSDQDWGAVLTLRKRLAAASALQWAGRYDEGHAEATAVLEEGRALGWEPLIVAAQLQVGQLYEETGKYEEAAQSLRAAYFDAVRVGADELAAEAALGLTKVVGSRLKNTDAGLQWGEHAAALLDRLGDEDGHRRGTLLHALAGVRNDRGEFSDAVALYEHALAVLEATLGPDHPTVASTLNDLAAVHQRMGELVESQALHQRALEILQRTVGPDHPDVASSLNNIAIGLFMAGRFSEAEAALTRAIAILEPVVGPDHPRLGRYLSTLGRLREQAGDYAAAKSLYERALSIAEAALGPDHPDLVIDLSNLGSLAMAQQDIEAARRHFQRAVDLTQRTLGPDHPNAAGALVNLGMVLERTGEPEVAIELYERSLAGTKKAYGLEHPAVGASLCNLANAHGRLEHRQRSIELFEECVAVYDAVPGIQDGEARARFALAKAIWAADGDRDRALEQARRSREAVLERGADPSSLGDVDAWIEERTAGR